MGARAGESSRESGGRGEGEVEKREERGRRMKGMEGKKKSSKNSLGNSTASSSSYRIRRQGYCFPYYWNLYSASVPIRTAPSSSRLGDSCLTFRPS